MERRIEMTAATRFRSILKLLVPVLLSVFGCNSIIDVEPGVLENQGGAGAVTVSSSGPGSVTSSSTAGGATSSSSTGDAASASSGGATCALPSECPQGGECDNATCINGVCGLVTVNDGQPCSQPGYVCQGGACACLKTECSGECVDTSTDPSHCGMCSNVCPIGASCAAGTCACPAGTTDCAGTCTDTSNDSMHCGACGSPCQGGGMCIASTCQLPCPGLDIGAQVPQTLVGDTTGKLDEMGSPCGGSGSPESTFTFTAPSDGFYSFDTLGSDSDTVLYVLYGACDGELLACSDDEIGPWSQVVVELYAGLSVVVVVDGYGASSGQFYLNIDTAFQTCPEQDLEHRTGWIGTKIEYLRR